MDQPDLPPPVGFSATWFMPSLRSGLGVFTGIQRQVLDVLCASYGSLAYASDVHQRRLLLEPQLAVVLAEVQNQSKVVACSYVRLDGKRGATAVSPGYRGRGLGTWLVRASLGRIPHQIAEVESGSHLHRQRLFKAGFRYVADEAEIALRIPAVAHLISGFALVDGELVYQRRSRDNPGLVHSFVMMTTHPRPSSAHSASAADA